MLYGRKRCQRLQLTARLRSRIVRTRAHKPPFRIRVRRLQDKHRRAAARISLRNNDVTAAHRGDGVPLLHDEARNACCAAGRHGTRRCRVPRRQVLGVVRAVMLREAMQFDFNITPRARTPAVRESNDRGLLLRLRRQNAVDLVANVEALRSAVCRAGPGRAGRGTVTAAASARSPAAPRASGRRDAGCRLRSHQHRRAIRSPRRRRA